MKSRWYAQIRYSILNRRWYVCVFCNCHLFYRLHCFRLKFNCLVLLYTMEINSILYTLYRPLKILNIPPDFRRIVDAYVEKPCKIIKS